MAMTTGWTTSMLLIGMVASLLTKNSVNAVTIDIINQCGGTITACAQSASDAANCYVLNSGGGTQQIDVGGSWPAGAIWAFRGNSGDPATGVQARPQADLAEFTIGGAGNEDTYDISNVNAYNLGISITLPTIAPGDSPGTQHCVSISCTIPDLNAFCQPPNTLTGPPGDGCYNTDGPGASQPTAGTAQFKNACPDAYSWNHDDQTSTFTCGTGTTYQVTFCPRASVGTDILLVSTVASSSSMYLNR